ncbi:MAG: sporulation integral membrane protein YtvI [Clostridia bacterium]|nr:sporulation integral membrane protein YtvI [Clostridia bacterium]
MDKHSRVKNWALIGTVAVLLIYVLFKYFLRIALPFLLSYTVVSLVRPTIDKICKKTRASRLFVTIFVLTLSAVLLLVGLSLLLGAITEQIGNIANSLVENLSMENNYITKLFEFISGLEERIPFISSLTNESIYSIVTEMITEGVKSLSLKVTGWVASAIASFPEIMVTVIVMLLSLFYFAKDYDKIGMGLMSLLPKSISEKMPKIKNDILLVVSKYLKSYLLLLLITFAELFAGFLILGIENSFVLALIIAFVDILPILGVGTVLIPWAVILFIGGKTQLGIGILIVFLVVYVARQYAEPKIVSTQMDVHPLLTLFSMYAGLKLAGITGLIFAPLVAFIVKTTYKSFKKPKSGEKTVDNLKAL